MIRHHVSSAIQPWYQVFEKYSGEIDTKMAEFDKKRAEAMQPFPTVNFA